MGLSWGLWNMTLPNDPLAGSNPANYLDLCITVRLMCELHASIDTELYPQVHCTCPE